MKYFEIHKPCVFWPKRVEVRLFFAFSLNKNIIEVTPISNVFEIGVTSMIFFSTNIQQTASPRLSLAKT